jgi:AcrR family transcriptional regulator
MNTDAPAPRRGRRPGEPSTREAVLEAARGRFAAQGYDATTMRQVAGDAGVDAALVHYFFGTKADLFVAAVDYPVNPAEVLAGVLAGGADNVGERLLRLFLDVWDTRGGTPLFALLRSTTHDRAAAMLREFLTREVVGRVARGIDADEPELRATLCGSQLMGLAVARYLVKVEPLASADREKVVACVAPTLQRYLTGPL